MNGEYTVTVRHDFVAQHFLIGGDFGPENEKHSHHYRIELTLVGDSLDSFNYLVDITAIERELDAFVARFRDTTLNDQPEFVSQNPSIELFCRVAWQTIVPALAAETVRRATVVMHENEIASASFSASVG